MTPRECKDMPWLIAVTIVTGGLILAFWWMFQ